MIKKVNEQLAKYEIHMHLTALIGFTIVLTNLLNQL